MRGPRCNQQIREDWGEIWGISQPEGNLLCCSGGIREGGGIKVRRPLQYIDILGVDANELLITGQQHDYLLLVVVPNMEHYQRLLLDKITRIEGVTGVRSSFVLRAVVETTALPLGYL